MSNIDKQWLQQKIAEMEATRDEIPFGLDEDGSNTLASMKLALASLEAEPVAYIIQDADARSRGEKGILRYFANISDEDINEYEITVTPLYSAQPAPVSVPAAYEKNEDFSAYHEGWNACRAAMLQGSDGNSPVIPDCSCRTCRPVTFSDSRFVVCPECGNKRCPHANDHRNSCTGSNAPGQEGSAYPAAPQQEV